MDYVKRDLEKIFCEKISHRQQFSVLHFNSEATFWSKGLQQGTKENLKGACKFVNTWQPNGGTDFDVALEAAFSVPGVQAVFFLSDGEYQADANLIEKVRRWSKHGQIHCHTTAFFASPSGQRLLEEIAKVTNGTYFQYEE